ncbi:MAG TPA: GNAT family N-acetyltransferase [Chloroflexota bacterium]|jgi:GNAT superfamily N-acetyltransferase|nr:GNAT family N-acetyltransferase [Chloroflexota bacterium]
MIVPLLTLPDSAPEVARLRAANIVVRRAQTLDLDAVYGFVDRTWPESPDWGMGVRTAFVSSPVRVFIATENGAVLGFSAYDIDYRGLFGPTGVVPSHRGLGIGAALLLRCLAAMREAGYLYAIIGAVGPAAFYTKVCGAMSLPRDWPNYTDPDRS